MSRLSIDAFADPKRRPRALIWTGVVVLAVAVLMVVAIGVTSTYWFCANGCHRVQDDTITAYDASSHANVSCMACHMPVGADPVTFVFHKAEALGELYLTVTNSFELPLNGHSKLALEMESGQCTQCHSSNRAFTPSRGIVIDHGIHAENDIACTVCHNRVAHPENFELALEGNRPHGDFMTMTACFRCHSQEVGNPPGACAACHPEDFEFKPASHLQPGFYDKGGDSSGHATLAKQPGGSTGITGAGETASAPPSDKGSGARMAQLDEIDYCGTCHAPAFCTGCHGMQMPHPADFAGGHGKAGKATPEVCANCHSEGTGSVAGSAEFCNQCHHEVSDPARSWISQHFEVVQDTGAKSCFECHESTYCAACHVRGLAEAG